MIIILEGPDGSGKTTLGEKLADALGYRFVHFSYPKNKEEGKQLKDIYYDFLASNNNVVVDRLWPSTVVYGPIMRGQIEISDVYIDMLDLAFKDKCIIIYCTGDPTFLWKHCQERGEDYIPDKSTFMQICQAYDKLLMERHMHTFVTPYIWHGNMQEE